MKIGILIFISIALSCNNTHTQSTGNPPNGNDSIPQHATTQQTQKIDYTGPATIVYKTKNNYDDKVPVTMNDERTKITSYPAPQDIYYNGKFATPTPLSNGYLLDNRGINKNVAFLNISYSEYSKLSSSPLPDDMMKMIIDKNPLTEMYNCGNRHEYKDEVAELDTIIERGQLNKFRKLY